jgi:phosphate transporter
MRKQEVRPLRQIDDKFGWLHFGIIGICLVTMSLWCANTWVEQYLGGMGITALVPMVLLFGSGIITTQEFETFPWNVVMLAMGGVVLGDAATNSGLLSSLAGLLASLVSGLPLWQVSFTPCVRPRVSVYSARHLKP